MNDSIGRMESQHIPQNRIRCGRGTTVYWIMWSNRTLTWWTNGQESVIILSMRLQLSSKTWPKLLLFERDTGQIYGVLRIQTYHRRTKGVLTLATPYSWFKTHTALQARTDVVIDVTTLVPQCISFTAVMHLRSQRSEGYERESINSGTSDKCIVLRCFSLLYDRHMLAAVCLSRIYRARPELDHPTLWSWLFPMTVGPGMSDSSPKPTRGGFWTLSVLKSNEGTMSGSD